MRSASLIPCVLAACGLISSCALTRTGAVVRAEFCDNSSCRLLGLPEETRTYENCLLVERQFDDGTPYQVVDCLPTREEAPEYLGEFVSGSVYERIGPVAPNTPLYCRVVPEYGMECWPSQQAMEADSSFTVFLLQFPRDLEDKGLIMDKGTVYPSCTLHDQGMVGCYVIDNESPTLAGIYFTAQPGGFSPHSLLPYGTTVSCQYLGGERLQCWPATP